MILRKCNCLGFADLMTWKVVLTSKSTDLQICPIKISQATNHHLPFLNCFLFSVLDINKNTFSKFQPTACRLSSVRPHKLWCNRFIDNMNINPPHLSDFVNNLTSWIILDLTATAGLKPGCSPASWFSWDDTNEAGATDSAPLGTN